MKLGIISMMVMMCYLPSIGAFHIDKLMCSNDVKKLSPLPVENFFVPASLHVQGANIVTDPLNLLQVAQDVLHHFKCCGFKTDPLINPAGFRSLISPEQVQQTLKFLIDVIQEDKESGNFRILDPKFLEENFGVVRWDADWKRAQANRIKMPHDKRIRLTSYGIWTVKGSNKKTASHPCGLYQLLDSGIAQKYTKHQILAGVLERAENRTKCRALAWVSRQDLEDALMQGTVIVAFPDGQRKVLKVWVNNGIAFDWHQKNILAQKRYWFFKELKVAGKSNTEIVNGLRNRKNVIFAGDLANIGVGKLIAIRHQNPITKRDELRLGLLADTGGAFENNLYQLDFFSGVFENKSALKRHLRGLPMATRACILYKK